MLKRLIFSLRGRLGANLRFWTKMTGIRAWDPLRSIQREKWCRQRWFSASEDVWEQTSMFWLLESSLSMCSSMEFIFWKPLDSCFQGKEHFAKVPATITFSGLYASRHVFWWLWAYVGMPESPQNISEKLHQYNLKPEMLQHRASERPRSCFWSQNV